jgi:hypothetical protein
MVAESDDCGARVEPTWRLEQDLHAPLFSIGLAVDHGGGPLAGEECLEPGWITGRPIAYSGWGTASCVSTGGHRTPWHS